MDAKKKGPWPELTGVVVWFIVVSAAMFGVISWLRSCLTVPPSP